MPEAPAKQHDEHGEAGDGAVSFAIFSMQSILTKYGGDMEKLYSIIANRSGRHAIFIVLICAFALPTLLTGCSDEQIEEFAFRKTMEYELIELCDNDEECIQAVKDQIKECMEKSDWRRLLDNEDDEEEMGRFTTKFYACIVDSEGNPYFEPKQN